MSPRFLDQRLLDPGAGRDEGVATSTRILHSMEVTRDQGPGGGCHYTWCVTHHAWRDLNLMVLTNEKDLDQACLFTQWSAKMLVPEIIEGEIWHNCKYLR